MDDVTSGRCVWRNVEAVRPSVYHEGSSETVAESDVYECLVLSVDGSTEVVSDCSSAWRPRQRLYWSRDDRPGLVGHRVRSLDTGDGFTSSPGYYVASAPLAPIMTFNV